MKKGLLTAVRQDHSVYRRLNIFTHVLVYGIITEHYLGLWGLLIIQRKKMNNKNTKRSQTNRELSGRNGTTRKRKQRVVEDDNTFENYRGGSTGNRTSGTRSTRPNRQTNRNQSQAGRSGSGGNNARRRRPVPKRKKRGLNKFIKVLLILVALLAAFLIYTIGFANLNSDLKGNLDKYNISQNAADVALSHRIVNVAVFGVDSRADVEGERSDTIMIVSADFEHGAVKVTSLMRDTYVYINEEYGYDKLNAAYSYGGAEMALQTINKNFDTAITDYATIDFSSMVDMVNAVGGVTLTIETDEELYWVNQYLMDVNDKVGTHSPFLETTGEQVLDGSQALAYCRIRYTGNGDFDRTQRQRAVFEQVMTKAMDLNPIAQYKLITKMMPNIDTSLSMTEVVKYAGNALFMKSRTIQQMRLPSDDFVDTGILDEVSYVFPVTLTDNIRALYQFIYQIDYTPSSTAQAISEEIEYVW